MVTATTAATAQVICDEKVCAWGSGISDGSGSYINPVMINISASAGSAGPVTLKILIEGYLVGWETLGTGMPFYPFAAAAGAYLSFQYLLDYYNLGSISKLRLRAYLSGSSNPVNVSSVVVFAQQVNK
jgi:hypothetical protein